MNAFTGPLSITELDRDWRLWRLNEDLVYEMGDGRSIVAPAGMITDGASVPQALWNILPPWGSYSRAAAIHDRLCYLVAIGAPHDLARTYEEAANVFDDAMGACSTPFIERKLIANAVRAWFELPDHFRPGDQNPLPCGSVQPLDVVLAHVATLKAAA